MSDLKITEVRTAITQPGLSRLMAVASGPDRAGSLQMGVV